MWLVAGECPLVISQHCFGWKWQLTTRWLNLLTFFFSRRVVAAWLHQTQRRTNTSVRPCVLSGFLFNVPRFPILQRVFMQNVTLVSLLQLTSRKNIQNGDQGKASQICLVYNEQLRPLLAGPGNYSVWTQVLLKSTIKWILFNWWDFGGPEKLVFIPPGIYS